MKVFVAGGTGVLGRRVVPLLLAAGHDVVAIARSAPKADQLRAAGAEPVEVDLFDAGAVHRAVAAARADVVMNLATHIPPLAKAARPSAWEENDRIRTEGAHNLVDAALAAGAGRYIQESITFTYADGGAGWLDEGAPIDPGPALGAALVAESEAARFAGAGVGTAVVLRFAMFYGPDSDFTQDMLRAASLGLAPVVGPREAYQAMIHLDDAATAVVAALEAPGGVYNVVDDEPLTRAAVARVFARAAGRRRAARIPAPLVKAGGDRASYLARSQRVSNARLRAATGWAPEHPSLAAGLVPVARHVPVTTWAARRWMSRRIALLVLAASALQIGAWAALAPSAWFSGFPGLGLAWTAADGPFNEHLSRDVGNLFLALAVVTIAVVARPDRFWVRVVAAAWLSMSVPHLTYHALHLGALPAWSSALSLAALGVTVVVPSALLWRPAPVASPQRSVGGAKAADVAPLAA